ncbi:BolA family transcriptional regulator [Thiomicrorhabdus sp. 6S2-11]|uniref:BolA family transcriptional regulator n=1 Tax=Thiomicrorhabdus marina TaxID=2818442 RepID=A0ABS3Q1M5_9GAMM|nr:BolA family protein [Thiomicrorhabdus marina]MBO1926225.1 BolA family transcriptional regulator [Thiomicrorhabdus marina]
MQIQTQIEQAIQETFQVAFMQLLNESHMHAGPADESHFKLTLVSEDFESLNRVKRQQAVYRALHELMPQFHALALHTYTPQEWQEKGGEIPASPKCGGGH